jgi:hypothetical protein
VLGRVLIRISKDRRHVIAGGSSVQASDMGMIKETELSFGRSEVYECGAALLVLLACPEEESDRQGDLHASCGKALWLQHLADPNSIAPISVKPQYVFRDRAVIDRDFGFVAKRVEERLVAGRMAVPFLLRAEQGHEPRLPPGIKRLSVNQMAEFVLQDAEQTDPSNLKRRYWAPSGPVIHLAAAAAVVGQELQKRKPRTGLEDFLTEQGLIQEVIRRGQLFADLIAADPKFPVKASKLVKVSLV